MKQFRDYQTEASNAILTSWGKHKSGICVMATGGGKTVVAAGTTARIQDKGKVLYLANRNELCMQPLAVFAGMLGEKPGLEKAESRAPLDSQVVIGSVQSFSQKRLDRYPKDHFSYIFADECHGCASETWKRIFAHFDQAKLCGITATPFRSDAKTLTDIFETESYRKDLFSLVDEGWLCDPCHVERLKTAISLATVRIKRGADGVKDYDVNDAASAIEPYFDAIAQELAQKHASKHILAFLPLVNSSEKFVRACQAAGINAIHVDGNDPERDSKLLAFKEGKIQLLSNSNLLHTGVDIPICDTTLNLRPTKSKVLYQQVIGRSTRTVPGLVDDIPTVAARLSAIAGSSKPRAYIIDPMWLSEDHDLVTPSFLIAPDEKFANEMDAAADPDSYNLRDLARDIQAEREAAIRRRLERVANFRDGKLDAEWFAAAIGDHELVNYEAVYNWENWRLRNFTVTLLSQAGIDPATVKNEGHAQKIMRAVYRRRHRKLAEIRQLADLADNTGVDNQAIWQVTQRELIEIAPTIR
jgi:superfamily II DNA or RNA helicase